MGREEDIRKILYLALTVTFMYVMYSNWETVKTTTSAAVSITSNKCEVFNQH